LKHLQQTRVCRVGGLAEHETQTNPAWHLHHLGIHIGLDHVAGVDGDILGDGEDEMRDTIDMAREAVNGRIAKTLEDTQSLIGLEEVKRFEALVRADEREEFQRWFDAVIAQHKQEILAEREACAKMCEAWHEWGADGVLLAKAIRARGETK